MSIEALLISHDPNVLRLFTRALTDVSIASTSSPELTGAIDLIRQKKYDALVVDCDDVSDGMDALAALRNGRSNRFAIAFAVTNGHTSVRTAYDAGANFVLEKPLTPERVARSVRAAHGLIHRERRRYCRHDVSTDALLEVPGQSEQRCTIVNVSEGGLAVAYRAAIPQKTSVSVRFRLPDERHEMQVRAEVSWSRDGQLGVRFLTFSGRSREYFERWMAARVEEEDAQTAPTLKLKR